MCCRSDYYPESEYKGYCAVCGKQFIETGNRCDKHKNVTDEENKQIEELFYIVAAINRDYTNVHEAAANLHAYLEKWYK